MTVRVAVALGYLGAGFCGSQVQPDVRTVQGEMEAALIHLTWAESGTHPVTLSSRTDAGVDARMNIGSFDLASSIWERVGAEGVVQALNDQMGVDVRVYGAEAVDPDFKTRNASSRTYLFRLQALEGWRPVDASVLAPWCAIFEGEHDFRNFCRPVEGRSTTKRVLECAPWCDGEGGVLGFRITAEGFVWNQVRRIASALRGLAEGRFTAQAVRDGLDHPAIACDFGRAEPTWLSLWSIEHRAAPGLVAPSSEIAFTAETPPTGRLHRLWRERARNEQDLLHQSAWLAALS